MARDLPVLEPTLVLQGKGYREVLIREMDAGKIPLSLGKKCPVECSFCYELDHSYRETQDPPKTTQDDWEFILNYINAKPTDPMQFWCLGGNEYMEWTDLFLHPKAMEWIEDFLKYTDKNLQFFTVGFVHVPKIHRRRHHEDGLRKIHFTGNLLEFPLGQIRPIGNHGDRIAAARLFRKHVRLVKLERSGGSGHTRREPVCCRTMKPEGLTTLRAAR